MKNLFCRMFLFLMPILLIILFPLALFYYSGEFLSMKFIRGAMRNGPVLYGKAYIVENAYDFKIPIILEVSPRVMTMGNSRVLQFRSAFFKGDINFYNGGSLINNFDDLKRVMEYIPSGQRPDVVIIGLDFYAFHPQADSLYKNNDIIRHSLKSKLLSGFRGVYRDLMLGKFDLSDVFSRRENGEIVRIGLKARANNDGYLNDGSYHYGKFISDPNNQANEDYGFKDTLRRIDRGTQSFYGGNDISPVPIAALTDFLEYAKENHIYVIGFHPPYAPTIFDTLKSRGNEYSYMFRVNPTLKPIFSRFRASLFDFSDVRSLGSSDREFVDGFHGGEKTYLRLFIKMAEADPVLRKYVDLDYLKAILKNTTSDLEVFPTLAE